MPETPPFSDGLSPEKLEEIEISFLQRLEEGAPIADLASTARMVHEAGEEDQARILLEMLEEELRKEERWGDRLLLLREVGSLLAGEELHGAILDAIRKRWAGSPSLEGLVEEVGLLRAPDDIPKTWKKVEKLEGLLGVDVGTVVEMEGKGAGTVTEANLQLQKFKVKFENGIEIGVGFGGAAKLLRPLPPHHVLRRRVEEPEELARLAQEDPAELARIALQSYDEPRTGAELKRDLVGPVPAKKWSSWWTALRKLPQLVPSPARKNAWQWAGSPAAVEDAVRDSFAEAAPREKLELFRRNSDRSETLLSWMEEKVADVAREVSGEDPALAAELWIGLDKLGRDPDPDAPWSPGRLLAEHDLFDLARRIGDRLRRERLCEIATSTGDHGEQLGRWLLQGESELRAVETIAPAVGATHPAILEGAIDRVLQKPAESPALFVWVAERAGDDEELRRRHAARLLPQLLFAVGDGRFGTWKTPRLEPLFEAGRTVARIVAEVSADQASGVHTMLERSAAVPGHLKTPLLNALVLRYPELRGDVETTTLYATPGAIDAKREELRRLREEEIPANRKAIQEARELGDLRENFEYKSARQRHEYLSARVGALAEQLSRARPIDFSQVQGAEVVIGCRVALSSAAGKRTLTILGPWDSDPERDVLSNESDLARSLLGLAKGGSIDIDGTTWTVETIESAG